jgi:DNA-damage-inducible protein J
MTKTNFVTIQARIDESLKTEADKIFEAMGLKMSEAIRMFIKQSVNYGGLPFQPRAKFPAEETALAIEELENKKGKKFKNSKELFDKLDI